MAKFVYVYIGGQMAETPEAQEQAMQAWGAWLGTLATRSPTWGTRRDSATVSSGVSPTGASLARAATRSCRPARRVMRRRRQRAARC